ncbi:MAG: hypothetical protein IPK82_19230 [Polyangiaceae bacterium]|nr:hypothetical protein [Polyangiaceae bacterium]
MKSLALSLVVAIGLSLGVTQAMAETPRSGAATSTISQMQEAARLAKNHSDRAAAYRARERAEGEAAQHCIKVALADEKQGFLYQAGLMRAKAAGHQNAAVEAAKAAQKEEALAQFYRLQAKRFLAETQKTFGGV